MEFEFCRNDKCPFLDCQDHPKHAPYAIAYTALAKDADCKRWQEREEIRRKMTGGDAFLIFQNIDTVDLDDALKGEAVLKIINLPTHMGVTKDMMLKVIRWLLGLCFELPEEGGDDNGN